MAKSAGAGKASHPLASGPGSFDLGAVKNRIIERRLMRPGELLDSPGQWRAHTTPQAEALAGVLREIGITDTLKAWYSERAGGKLVTWDGHLRKSLDPNLVWPVDITDLTDAEADLALATHDPISAMAGADAAALDALLSGVATGEAALQQMFADLAAQAGLYREIGAGGPSIDFAEHDESEAEGVPMQTCPNCGHQFPK